MLAKLFIPVAKTIEESSMNSSNFLNKTNLSDEEVQTLAQQEDIRRAMYGGLNSLNNRRPYEYSKEIITSEAFLNEFDYDYQECEALILNKNKEDMKEDEFTSLYNTDGLSIIMVNINPNSLTQESESELRYWIEESKRILRDNEIPNDVKIKSLPFCDFKIETEGGAKAKLDGCKFVKNYASPNFKYFFANSVYGIKEE